LGFLLKWSPVDAANRDVLEAVDVGAKLKAETVLANERRRKESFMTA
jgi:hypothetical protein